MGTEIVLCADSESVDNPQIIGLDGENLEAQNWLRVFCSAVEARRYLQESNQADEVWVASSDDVDPINLAAALKKDSEEKGVYLLAFQGTGSLKSRANAAGLNGTLSQQDFLARYTKYKQETYPAQKKVIEHAQPLETENSAGNNKEARYPEKFKGEFIETPNFQLEDRDDWEQDIAYEEETFVCCEERIRKPIASVSTNSRAAHVFSVVSASGGAGKSTMAVLAALFAQGLGYKTLLLDADLQFGDMRYFLADESPLTIDEVLRDPQYLPRLAPEGLKPALLAAPTNLEESEWVMGEIPGLLETLKSSFDVIVVNTGAFWSEQHAALLERSSTALFLVDQRSSSLRACKHALDLCVRCGIATHPFLFALNRCSRSAPLTSIDVSCALQGAHVLELPEGGRDVNDLLAAGLPFELIETCNDLCLSIEKMLIDVLPPNEQSSKITKMPVREPRRFSFGRRRRAACL